MTPTHQPHELAKAPSPVKSRYRTGTSDGPNAGTLYICSDKDFTGECHSNYYLVKQCWAMPSFMDNRISSIRPGRGVEVIAYDAGDCTGPGLVVDYPGIHDLAALEFNDKISSLRIVLEIEPPVAPRQYNGEDDIADEWHQMLELSKGVNDPDVPVIAGLDGMRGMPARDADSRMDKDACIQPGPPT
ncbi:hypothetical protein M422DRAFT_41759 [Sphaerobolus stellatus SS14]|nr:hypothetical protein M422DRAFT_41759 [Sphaerobolus stellatus SS14]